MNDSPAWRLARQTELLAHEFAEHGIALDTAPSSPVVPPTGGSLPMASVAPAPPATSGSTPTALLDPAHAALAAADELAQRLSRHQLMITEAAVTARRLGTRATRGFARADELQTRFEHVERELRVAFDRLGSLTGVEQRAGVVASDVLLELQAARDTNEMWAPRLTLDPS